MTEITKLAEFVYASFSADEIVILNGILKIKDADERYLSCRKFVFTNQDIYLRIKAIVDPSWLIDKLYTIGRGHEF